MAYVSTDVYIAGQQSLEARLSVMESKLNELFGKVDQKMSENTVQTTTMATQIPLIITEMERMRLESKSLTDETKALSTTRADRWTQQGRLSSLNLPEPTA